MPKIVLVSCSASKSPESSPARELYTGTLFKESLAYAEKLQPDAIFILSALHGLVRPDQLIAPYNVTLSPVSKKIRARQPDLRVLNATERKAWALLVRHQLGAVADLQKDQFVLLAGQSYIKPLRPYLAHIEEPMKGLSFALRTPFLREILASAGS